MKFLVMLASSLAVMLVASGAFCSFNPNVNGPVNAALARPDGKILIGGPFTAVGGIAHGGVAQLNADGSPDSLSEILNLMFDGQVRAFAIQADGKILVGGDFTHVMDNTVVEAPIVYTYGGVARLNSDGSVDTTFHDLGATLSGGAASIRSIAIQSVPGNTTTGGNILVGGAFDVIGGLSRKGIARVTNDLTGAVDSFNPVLSGSSQSYPIINSIISSNSNIMVGGDFFVDTGSYHTYMIARLSWGGQLDTAFNPLYPNGAVTGLAVQSDGQTVLTGSFTALNDRGNGTAPTTSVVRNGIARLADTGAVDGSFDPNMAGSYTVVIQPDGKILVGGSFQTPSGMVARLTSAGAVDGTFVGSVTTGTIVAAIALQADGGVLIGGGFSTVNGFARNNMARLEPGAGAVINPYQPQLDGTVVATALQPDGKLYIGGSFTTVNGTPALNVARLNADGSIDISFRPNLAPGVAGGTIKGVAVLPDSKILLSGLFSADGGATTVRLARFSSAGVLDGTFNAPAFDKTVSVVLPQPDGTVLVGGLFTTTPRAYLARLKDDGIYDSTFAPVFNNAVFTVSTQQGGKLLVGGMFTKVNNVNVNRVVRLNLADGTTDTSFTSPITATSGAVAAIVVQRDNKVVVGCTGILGTQECVPGYKWLGRLSNSGTVDATFSNAYKPNNGVDALLLQADQKIWIGGGFTLLGAMSAGRIARLNSDGTVDRVFGTGADNWIYSIALNAIGEAFAGGGFSAFSGASQQWLGRIANLGASLGSVYVSPHGDLADFTRSGAAPDATIASVQYSDDGKQTWTAIQGSVDRPGAGYPVFTFSDGGASLPRGKSLDIKAVVVTQVGLNGGSQSAEVFYGTACLTPSSPKASMNNLTRDSFDVFWQESQGETYEFRVLRAPENTLVLSVAPIDGLPPGWQGRHVSGLSPATLYVYQIFPSNACGLGSQAFSGFYTKATLSVTVGGNGGGTVVINPGGIVCQTDNSPITCAEDFDGGVYVTLTAVPDSKSKAGSFTGACTPGEGGTCTLAMTADWSISVDFNLSDRVQLMQNSVASLFPAIAGAYASAQDGGVLNMQGITFTENPTFDKLVSVVLNGGYDSSYAAAAGTTLVQGTVSVGAGEVTVNTVTVQGKVNISGGKLVARGLTVTQ